MAGLKKLGAVTLAVLFAAVAAYVLRPTGNPTGTVNVNEPDVPDTPTDDPGDEPTSPPAPPHGLEAQNSNGPRSAVCLPANDHVPDHAADEGANRYRGSCLSFPGRGPR